MPGYTLPDGITLKNKLGATNHQEIEDRETEPVRQRLFEIEMGYGPTGRFDVQHLKAIHRYLFQDVYEWAGHTRDERVSLSDGTVATEPLMRKPGGQPFMLGPAIAPALDDWAARLAEVNHLRGLPREEFAERAADAMAELNAVHPFREGNGRTQRVFMEQLARTAGHDLDFTVVSKERMIQASIAANEQADPSMMRRVFEEISDPERVALLREGIEKLQSAFDRAGKGNLRLAQNWNDRYVATLTPGHEVELVFAGAAGDQFMARTQTQILFGKAADLPEPYPGRGDTFRVTAGLSAGTDINLAEGQKMADTYQSQESTAALDMAGNVAEGVSAVSEKAINTLADSMASLLGGGASAPTPVAAPEVAPPSQEERMAAFLQTERAEQQQQGADLQEKAKSSGISADVSQEAGQEQRDRGGGISR